MLGIEKCIPYLAIWIRYPSVLNNNTHASSACASQHPLCQLPVNWLLVLCFVSQTCCPILQRLFSPSQTFRYQTPPGGLRCRPTCRVLLHCESSLATPVMRLLASAHHTTWCSICPSMIVIFKMQDTKSLVQCPVCFGCCLRALEHKPELAAVA
jgi:hypothetical protein